MIYRIKMTHINHLTGQISDRWLKRRYPSYQQAARVAQGLSFERKLNDHALIAQCIAVPMQEAVR